MASDGGPPRAGGPGLRVRVIALAVGLTVVLTSALVATAVVASSRISRFEINERARALTAFLAASATDPLANLDLKALRALVAEVREGEDVVDAFVFDEELRVLTDGTLQNPRRHVPVGGAVGRFMPGAGGQAPVVAGERVWLARPILVGDRLVGGVLLELSLERLDRERRRYLTRSLALALAVALTGGVLAWVVAGAVIRPLERLTSATRAVARGDLDGKVGVESGGEVGTLAASFNRMVDRLRDTTVSRDSIDAVLRSMEEGLIVLDGEARVRAANPAALALLGAASEPELRGRAATDLIGADRHEAERRLALAMAGEDPAAAETVLRRIDGTPVPVELSLAPVRVEGLPGRVVCVARDVRERLRAQRLLEASEERYRRLVELAPDGIVVVRDGVVAFVNPAGAVCLGGGAVDRVVGRPLADFLAPEQRKDAALLVDGVARSGIGVASHGQRWRTADGRPFDAEVAATPMVFDGVGAVLLVVRDVSERRSIERMKDEFVATVSHELRTPLTSILGSLGLVLGGVSGELPTEARSMLEVADRNGRRLLRLINDLLDLEKLDAGRMTFRLETVSLAAVVGHAVEANRGYADAHGITLEVVHATGGGSEVRVDAERLHQVLANLLSNAVKHAPRRSRVTVRISRRGDRLEVGVRDRGPGIPEALAPRLFERFVQSDAPDRQRSGGTGLGLAISRTLVERMGGTIGFTRPEDGGAEFWVRFPAAAGEGA